LLGAGAAAVFNTSNTPREREEAAFGDPLEAIWKKCIFGLCGVKTVRRKTFSVVVTSTAAEREGWLARVREMVAREFPSEAKTVEVPESVQLDLRPASAPMKPSFRFHALLRTSPSQMAPAI